MKRLSTLIGLSVMLVLATTSPSLAAKKKASSAPPDTTPVVTPDTTPPPSGTAAPTATVQVGAPGTAATTPAAPYAIPVGGAQPQPTAVAAPTPAPLPGPPVMVRAEQCLRTNVERVVHAEPGAKLAVDMLLSDVCAEEVDAASMYVRNLDALAEFNPTSERGRAGLSTAHVNPETGQIIAPPNVDVSSAVEHADQVTLEVAPSLRKFTAELVLTEKGRLSAPTTHLAAAPAKKSH